MTRHLALAAGLALCWVLSNTVLSDNFGSRIRFVTDDYERRVYMQRGAWALHGLVPYRETFSEYPNIATYALGLPYFIAGNDFTGYRTIFSLMGFVYLGATIVLLRRMLAGRESLAYLMLLPAPLYLTINRFDLLAAFFVLLSLWSLQRDRYAAAGLALALAVLTKWYPVLLLPLVLSYAYRRQPPYARTLLIALVVACAVIIAPTLMTVGLRPMLRPYAFHASRGLEMASLPALVHWALQQWAGVTIPPRLVSGLGLAGVMLTVAASVRAKADSIVRVACWSTIVVTASILMSTVWSPQWLLWLMPLMILIVYQNSDAIWIVAYGIIGYVVFPLIHDGFHGAWTTPLWLGSLVVYVILLRTIVVAYRRAKDPPLVNAFAANPASP